MNTARRGIEQGWPMSASLSVLEDRAAPAEVAYLILSAGGLPPELLVPQ